MEESNPNLGTFHLLAIVIHKSLLSACAAPQLLGETLQQSLDEIELQFALSRNAPDFQTLVWYHLKTVLTGLNSNSKEISSKSLVILGHVCKRLNNEATVKLPLGQLLEMISINKPLGLSQKNITMLLIEMGYKRALLKETIETIPDLLNSITELTAQQQAIIIGVLFQILSKCGELNNSDTKKFEKAIMNVDQESIKYMFSLMAILMIYEIPNNSTQEYYPEPPVYLGIPFRTMVLRGKHPWTTNKDALNELKLGILSTLSRQKIFKEKEYNNGRIIVLICASVDNCSDVNSAAKLNLKISSDINLDDNPQLLCTLSNLYKGDIYGVNDTRCIDIPVNLKLAIIKLLQRARVLNYHEPIFDEAISTNPVYLGSKLYIELLKFGLKALNDPNFKLTTLQVNNIMKVFLHRLEFCDEFGDGKLEVIKSLLYQIVGTLCKKLDFSEQNAKTAFLKLLWGVCNEPHSTRLAIQKVIMDILPLMKNIKLPEPYQSTVVDLALECTMKKTMEAFHCLVLLTNTVFNPESIVAKYINIIAIKRSRLGLEEAGRNGLKFPDPPSFPEENSSDIDVQISINSWRKRLPDFLEFIGLLSQLMRGKNVYNFKYYDGISKIENTEKERRFGGITIGALSLGLEFSRQLLILSADPWANRNCIGVVGTLGSNSVRVESTSTIQRIANYVTDMCTSSKGGLNEKAFELKNVDPDQGSQPVERPSLETYINLLIHSLCSPQSENLLKVICIHILNELVDCLYGDILCLLNREIPLLRGMLNASNFQISYGAANLIGALITRDLEIESNAVKLKKFVDELIVNTIQPPSKMTLPFATSGVKVALGVILGKTLLKYGNSAVKYISEEKMNQIMDIITSELLGQGGSFLITNMNSLCIAVSEACRYRRIPKWSYISKDEVEDFRGQIMSTKSVALTNYNSKPLALAKRLIYFLDSSSEQKSTENILNTLCDLSIDSPDLREILLKFFIFFAIRLSKKIDSLAILGESICKLISGRDSVLLERYFYIPTTGKTLHFVKSVTSSNVYTYGLAEAALNNLISPTNSDSTTPYNPKEYLVLLICIIKFSGTETAVLERRADIISLFARFLPDSDELLSNAAYDGICTLLSNASYNERLDLIELLENKLRRTVGQKGITESANSARLATYEIISSICFDLNRPDLICSLLLIVWSGVHWNSRPWMTAGTSRVSLPNLDDISKQLVSKLYVFKFHPNRKTSSDIDRIWKTLTEDKEDVINEYRERICDEILLSINHDSIVVKELGFTALENFVNSVELLPIAPKIMEIYFVLSGLLVNIIESVKSSAFSAGRALCTSLINCINDPITPISNRIPLVSKLISALKSQISSHDKIIHKFCLSTILKLQECNSNVLQESLEVLIKITFESFFTSNGPSTGHLSFFPITRSDTPQQQEYSNYESIKTSPTMSCLVKFYTMLPLPAANDIMHYSIEMLGNSTRFTQKAVYLSFIYQASANAPQKLTINDQLVAETLFPLVKGSSSVLSNAASLALGTLCKNSPSTISSLLFKVIHLYLNENESEARHLIGVCAYQILKNERTLEKNVLESFVPVAYIASRKVSKISQAEGWNKVWECVSSFISMSEKHDLMILCIKSAVPIIEHSQNCSMKVQAAIAVKEICSNVNVDINKDLAPKLLNAFVQAITVYSGDGIHEMIISFAEIVKHLAWYINDNESYYLNRKIILGVFLNGIRSKDAELTYYSLQVISPVYEMIGTGLYTLLQEPLMMVARFFSVDNHSKIVDSFSGGSLETKIRSMAFGTIKDLWHVSRTEMEEHVDDIVVFLISCLKDCVWTLQELVLNLLIVLIKDSSVFEFTNSDTKSCIKMENLALCTRSVLECARTAMHTEVIKRAFDCLEVLIMKLEQYNSPALEISLKEMSSMCESFSGSSAGVHTTAVFNRVKARMQPLPALF